MEKKGEFMGKVINQHQIFDNAFLSGCSWHKRLMIPIANEAFSINIPKDSYIEHSANEHFRQGTNETLIKRITDALVRVNAGKYHLECESKNDGQILMRIGDYDMQIAISDAEYSNYSVKMVLPETAVIFLRSHNKLPPKGTICYYEKDQFLTHTIPFIQVRKYSLKDLSSKNLYLLFPFYLIRYEHAINNTPTKFELIENEAHKVYDYLTDAYKNNSINLTEYGNILMLCRDVVSALCKDKENTENKERLINAMGNEVLLTLEERGILKGIEKGREEGRAEGREEGRAQGEFNMALTVINNAISSLNLTFDEVCDKLGIKDKEKYRSYI